ncbi:MAG TPA: hypothetical protein VGL38_15150 [bacterium]|jgi:hypothetical protein
MKKLFLTAALLCVCVPSFAQDMDMGSMLKTGILRLAHMNSVVLPDLPMTRDGSGTSWLPDATPMYAIMWGNYNWGYMAHGELTARYTDQDVARTGHRGADKFDGPNWFMFSANHPFALHKQITLRGMWSLDPLTEGKSGYPLLFQTGESVDGHPLIDRQHPHDLFSELSVIYGHALNRNTGYFVYVGYPGEPALGPPAFMHRPSAQHMIDAPLGHHWQDATHITFGVGTVGFRYRTFKLDGSIFTGREPNEIRADFDKPRFDSYSARLSCNPTERWALQVSGGYLKSPEELEPDINQYRATASAIYAVSFQDVNSFTVSAVWGMNKIANPAAAASLDNTTPQHSALLESDLRLASYAIFGRSEWVEKSAHELGLPQFPGQKFGVGALTLGLARDIFHGSDLTFMAGAQGGIFSVPDDLRPVYGQAPYSVELFLRLSPRLMMM